MKQLNKYGVLMLVLVTALIGFAGVAFAQDAAAVAADAPPAWLGSVMAFAQSVPVLGPIVVEVLKWLGVIASLLTAITSILLVVGKVAEKLGKSFPWLAGAQAAIAKAIYYIGFLSIYNVKK